MASYVVVFTLVWMAAFFEFANIKRSRFFLYASFGYVFFFVSLRFETGYDWVTYKNIFESVEAFSFSADVDYSLIATELEKEYGYIILNAVLKAFINDFQFLVFFVSSVYFISVVLLFNKISGRPAFVFAVSFCFLVFSVYFSVIRQSISIALFNYFLIAYLYRRFLTSFLLALLSISMQYSAAIYFVVFYFSDRLPRKSLLYLMMLVAFVLSFWVGHLFTFIAELQSNAALGWVEKKITWYFVERQMEVRLADKVFMYALVVVFFPVLVGGYYNTVGFWKKLCGMGVLLSFTEVLFIDYTVFRYRLFYALFPIQIVMATKLAYKNKDAFNKMVFAGAFVLSVGYSSLFLMKENALPFIPYQFWPTYYLYDLAGTGLERAGLIK